MNALWMLLGLIFCGAVLVAAVIWILVRRLHKYKQEEKENQPTDYDVQTQHTHEDIFSHRGLGGESQIYKCLQDLTGYKRFLVNCYVPKENGEKTEIDVILLHESGIYVLESKNFSGWIFGAENQTYWTQTLPDRRGGSKKIRFLNPMIQNAVHMKWLKVFLQEESLPFYSYIVFGNHCTLKQIHVTSERHHVLNQSSLLEDIAHRAEMGEQQLSPDQIDCIYDKLLPLTEADVAEKDLHIQQLREKYHPLPEDAAKGVCPWCGHELVLRTAKKGSNAGKRFWGCSNFPRCHYIKDIDSLM